MNTSHTLKTEPFPKLQARHGRRDRQGKARLLDELCEDYGYERKYAGRLLRTPAPVPTAGPTPKIWDGQRWGLAMERRLGGAPASKPAYGVLGQTRDVSR